MTLFQDNRQLSIGIVHYIYRNTHIVENSHSANIVMDKSFYSKVYQTVKRKLKTVVEFQKPLSILDDKVTIEQIMNAIPEESRLRFCKYVQEMRFHSVGFGKDWDLPSPVEEPIGNNLAKFILRGKFLECCQDNVYFNDKTMCEVNKDINNRVYTLLINDYL